ncbi:MAG: hypothetical protein EOO77_33675 [Oxalobacteraceae bacterium]|nr:MAG: hypothetical protein EOO77_33675 [Oxalobacteraceae bacterium]
MIISLRETPFRYVNWGKTMGESMARSWMHTRARDALYDLGIYYRFIGYGFHSFGGTVVNPYCLYFVDIIDPDETTLTLLALSIKIETNVALDSSKAVCQLSEFAYRQRSGVGADEREWEAALSNPPVRKVIKHCCE